MKREYGIDLLKMLAMVMVICHHILSGGGVEGRLAADGVPLVVQLFHCFCYCAVDCFVMATGFIMSRRDFHYFRIVKLWRLVVGYSLAIVAFAWLFVPEVEIAWRDWAGALFPVVFNRYWFFTTYVALFFTIPFLNRLLAALSDREKIALLASGFVILSLASLVAGSDLFQTKWGYSYIWFIYLYVMGASLALLDVRGRIKGVWLVIALMVGCVGSTTGNVASAWLPKMIGGGARVGDLAWSYTSPTILIEAVALLLMFARIRVGSLELQRLIAFVAPSTFIVYIVHSNDVFRILTHWKVRFLWLADGGRSLV